jgi:acetyltransferase-like isoleucine patch superfamily enzyme
MIIYRVFWGAYKRFKIFASTNYTKFLLSIFKVQYGKGLIARGLPILDIHASGQLQIGENLAMNGGRDFNRIGRQQRCLLLVARNAKLKIGNNVGISSSAIVCYHEISIGDNVKIGGNTVIYDTDFHSLDADTRLDKSLDHKSAVSKPVIIGKNVFIGAHTTILKGVEIGENSIIAACSVITKDIDKNEIWGGNPAKLIRKL